MDDAVVTEADVASNFFVRESDIGRPRCEGVKEMLCEMNPDTRAAEHVVQDTGEYIRSREGSFSEFSLVIGTQLVESQLAELGEACSASRVPLLTVRSYGLIGHVRIVTPRAGHPVVQTHLGRGLDKSDQWINNPWPELSAWRDTLFDLDKQSAIQHQHTPFPVVLHHLLKRYKSEHGDAAAANLDRSTFEKYIEEFSIHHRTKLYQQAKRNYAINNTAPAEPDDEAAAEIMADPSTEPLPLNYENAISNCFKALLPPHTEYERIPASTATILADPRADPTPVTTSSVNPASGDPNAAFWVVMQAVNRFVGHEGRGFLPVTGAVMDMAASSENFIQMQRVHHSKHRADVAAIFAHVGRILTESKLSQHKAGKTSDSESHNGGLSDLNLKTRPFADNMEGLVELVCKNIRELAFVCSSSLQEEFSNSRMDRDGQKQPGTEISTAAMMAPFAGGDPEMLGAVWYIMIRACDRFHLSQGTFPGSDPAADASSLEADAKIVEQHASEIAQELGLHWEHGFEKPSVEMTRYGASELHTVAAYVGGIAGQEAVKLISHQYVPLVSTFIYNGINGSTARYGF